MSLLRTTSRGARRRLAALLLLGATSHAAGACSHPGQACNWPWDCPVPKDCAVATCEDNVCGTTPADENSQCGGGFCDANGTCLDWCTACKRQSAGCFVAVCDTTSEMNCNMVPAPVTTPCAFDGGVVCDGHGACVPEHCGDGQQNYDETDVDCGGLLCAPCADAKKCAAATDCQSGVCSMKTCVPCATDADCDLALFCDAGVCAHPRPNGAACTGARQCAGGVCCPSQTCVEPCLVTLATGQDNPKEIVVDATSAYWSVGHIASESVVRCAVGGCNDAPTMVLSGPAAAFTVGNSSLYFVDTSGAAWRCPTSGCAGAGVFLGTSSTPAWTMTMAVDAVNAYWLVDYSDAVFAVPLTGGTPTKLDQSPVMSGETRAGIAADGTNVYWLRGGQTQNGSLLSCPIAGCGGSPVVLAPGLEFPSGIAVDGQNVYFANNDYPAHTVMAVPIGGGTPVALATASHPGSLRGVVLDAKNVYWTDGLRVWSCAKTGCSAPTALFWSPPGVNLTVESVAVDGANVYWTNMTGGTVFELPLQ